jgi:hypothetical protein
LSKKASINNNNNNNNNNVERFRIATKNFLLKESLYSIDEYLEWTNKNPL